MKVILLDDIERVGHEGDILTVADGYARNYLLPRKMAVEATKGAILDLERRKSAIERRDSEKRDKAQNLANELGQKQVVIKATAGEGTRLHGTITSQQIAEAVSAQLEIEVDRRDIDLAEPIRELGDYLISARLYKDVAAQLPISVISDKEEKQEDIAEEVEEAAVEEVEAVAETVAEPAAEEAAEAAPAEADTAEEDQQS